MPYRGLGGTSPGKCVSVCVATVCSSPEGIEGHPGEAVPPSRRLPVALRPGVLSSYISPCVHFISTQPRAHRAPLRFQGDRCHLVSWTGICPGCPQWTGRLSASRVRRAAGGWGVRSGWQQGRPLGLLRHQLGTLRGLPGPDVSAGHTTSRACGMRGQPASVADLSGTG